MEWSDKGEAQYVEFSSVLLLRKAKWTAAFKWEETESSFDHRF